ncbi:N-acetyltransferase family protein [Dactylosporangium sp. CA-139066]|uniref:GNAT family N-acetyltransferase n=1 Tax=Dactylosporangium sp. CA-139066 TaxID=3239930 RepID=UPI003D8AAE36
MIVSEVEFRPAGPQDAERVALLHADSWRRHYRGAYADAFLDGDVEADRIAVWTAKLASPAGTETVLAERDGRLEGFVHVVFDDDPRWGSLVDNLHVVHDRRRGGLGTRLLGRAAEAIGERAAGDAMYLWVLQQNTAAQAFYAARGGTCVETVAVSAPAGNPAWLNGAPNKLRMAWPDAATLRTA